MRGERCLDAVAPTLRANLVATVDLLEAATRAGCERIVMSGSLLDKRSDGIQGGSAIALWRLALAASAYGASPRPVRRALVNLRPSFAYGPGRSEQADPSRDQHPVEAAAPADLGERMLDCV